MPFKTHLIIVSVIIVIVWVAWALMSGSDEQTPVSAPAAVLQESSYSISISSASWGLNCIFRTRNREKATDNVFVDDGRTSTSKLQENNVLNNVTNLCNGKPYCDIPIGPQTLGDDPAPECRDKVLEVVYRCFSYDRPWTAKASNGTLSLNCEKLQD